MVGGAKPRVSSPAPGRSILITSAPRSPSICAQVGPARTRVRSNTRRPLRGPVGLVILLSSFWAISVTLNLHPDQRSGKIVRAGSLHGRRDVETRQQRHG